MVVQEVWHFFDNNGRKLMFLILGAIFSCLLACNHHSSGCCYLCYYVLLMTIDSYNFLPLPCQDLHPTIWRLARTMSLRRGVAQMAMKPHGLCGNYCAVYKPSQTLDKHIKP